MPQLLPTTLAGASPCALQGLWTGFGAPATQFEAWLPGEGDTTGRRVHICRRHSCYCLSLCASKANLVNDLKATAASGMISSGLLVCVQGPQQFQRSTNRFVHLPVCLMALLAAVSCTAALRAHFKFKRPNYTVRLSLVAIHAGAIREWHLLNNSHGAIILHTPMHALP